MHYKTFIWVCTQRIRAKPIHSFILSFNLGYLLWSLQSMRGIIIYNEERQKYSHYALPMLISFIDCKIYKRCPRLGMYRLCPNTVRANPKKIYNAHGSRKLWKSETSFGKECITTEKWKTAICHQIIPIKMYTHLLCTAKMLKSVINLVKRLVINDQKCKMFLTHYKNTRVSLTRRKGPLGPNSIPGTWRGIWPRARSIWPHYLSSWPNSESLLTRIGVWPQWTTFPGQADPGVFRV